MTWYLNAQFFAARQASGFTEATAGTHRYTHNAHIPF